MSFVPFVPLRIFSCYTMLDGAMEPKDIAKTAAKLGFPAISITDRNGLYAGMPFADGCVGEGIQPIIGTMLGVERPDLGGRAVGEALPIDWLALYAMDEVGYDNLCRLVSMAHLDRPLALQPHVPFAALHGLSDGLIALTAGGEGGITRAIAEGRHGDAVGLLDRLEALFPGRLYIELCRRGRVEEDAAEAALIDLAYARNLPLVATNPACYVDPGFHAAHDAMLCIAAGTSVDADDRVRSDRHAWIKSEPMMRELFVDLPEALANTLVVAKRCAVRPPKRKPILPRMGGSLDEEAAQLRADARAGLEERLSVYEDLSAEERAAYVARLDFEADVIVQMGFPGYFLIVADFIKWAKGQDIPVGPGRGSGAGSVVAWALTITDLDPLKLGLLFERFLNPERVSMPDFDIDFCETRRGEVIRYVQAKYGRDQVAQIITFGKLKARAVLRDTGRVLQMPYGQVDKLCKLVPNHPTDPWKLDRALTGVDDLRRQYHQNDEVRRLFDLGMQLEGLPRHSSTHAAGVVIGDRPLAELVPLYRDPRSDMPVTQFDMKYVEGAGLVKFDFLGLKTLSVLHKAVEMLRRRGIACDLSTLAWDDPKVYELLKAGDTVGVFQLESEGMRRTLEAVKPTNFGDIIALVSLYRPGPMDNIPLFGQRKNGAVAVEYPHRLLEEILSETYGIFVYQEQVMQAAQILAGYSLGGADLLRRAMGKKIKAEMDEQRATFVKGSEEHHGIPAQKANELFDLIDKFAGYGFNKSHAAAYALLAYQTAWLKAHYPHEFYAASMCFDMHQSDKLSIFVDDMRRNGIALLPPCVNSSEAEFAVELTADGPAVRYALAGLKNVGEKAMEGVATERQDNGMFASLDDFAHRIDPQSVNKRQLESLAMAGAFDALHPNRAGVLASADVIVSLAGQSADTRKSGQGGLFGDAPAATGAVIRLDGAPEWSAGERMAQERDAFGFYFSAHPVDQYRAIASANGAMKYADVMAIGDVRPGERRSVQMAALVEGVLRRKTRTGKDFVMVDFSDQSGRFSASCFEESLVDQFAEWASKTECVMLTVELDVSTPDQPPRVSVRGAKPLTGLKTTSAMMLRLDVTEPAAIGEMALILGSPGKGKGEVVVHLFPEGAAPVTMRLGKNFALDGELVDRLRPIPGLANIALSARKPELRVVR